MHKGLSTTYKFILLASFLIFLSCLSSESDNSGKLTVYQNADSNYTDITNEINANDSNTMWNDKVIGTDKYPLYLALYKDQVFHYEIPGLGEGKGKWSINKNQIKLESKRARFDMLFYIYQFKEDYFIKFSDRDGPKVYELQYFN